MNFYRFKIEIWNEYLFRERFQTDVFHVRYGVPQGSRLGPRLFNWYSSKIFDIVSRHLPKVHCYADDSQLYLSFNPSCAFIEDEAIRSSSARAGGGQWITSDNLMLNDDKTEFIVIASRRLLKKAAVNTIRVEAKCLLYGIWVRASMINLF